MSAKSPLAVEPAHRILEIFAIDREIDGPTADQRLSVRLGTDQTARRRVSRDGCLIECHGRRAKRGEKVRNPDSV
jgi:hypothetical protein